MKNNAITVKTSLVPAAMLVCTFTLTACNGAAQPETNTSPTQSADSQNATAQNTAGQGTTAQGTAGNTVTSPRPDRVPLVLGGSVVNDNRFPWMAAIVNAADNSASQGQFCGGSLIASRWVLTAAHCVEEEQAGTTAVLLGQPDLSDNNGERIDVSRIIMHPDYGAQGYPDLALLELTNASSAPVISLPSRNNPVAQDGETVTVIGWGQLSENGPASDQLRETTMPIVDHNTCNRAYNNEIVKDAMICAGSPNGERDSCYGDSGGPLFVKRKDVYVQSGIVSFGEACGLAGVPGVYTRLSSYYDWISAYAPATLYDATSTASTASASNSNEVTINTDNADSNVDAVDTPGDEGPLDIESPDNNPPQASETSWSFAGQLQGRWDEAYAPEDDSTIDMADGILSVTLNVPNGESFIVLVDEYDPRTDEWYEVAGAAANNGEAYLELDIAAGQYSFAVLSIGDGGSYTLDATLEPDDFSTDR